MGVGNTLLRDDGIGIHVASALRGSVSSLSGLTIIDGGTIGLALLPEVEESEVLVIVDATELGAPPGTVRVFVNGEIDRFLNGKRPSVHEVAIVDLLAAAGIRGRRPEHCALIGIQPASIDWGLELTDDVQAAVPEACRRIHEFIERVRHVT